MKAGILLNIAITHLRSKMRQTIIAALGVTFGIGMFIGMISFMEGLNSLLDDLMLQTTPHIRLYNEMETERENVLEETPDTLRGEEVFVHHQRPRKVSRRIRNALQILRSIRSDSRVYGVAPRITTQVFYNIGSIQVPGNLLGIEVEGEQRLFATDEYIIDGQLTDLLTVNDGIIIGSGLADKLNIGIDNRITLTSTTGGQFQLKVVGIFQVGISVVDESQSFTTLKTAQRIVGEGASYITDINIKLHDIEKAIPVAAEYQRRFEVTAEDYKTANAQMELGMRIRNIMTYVVSVALLIVAGFGIYNILNMFIYEKMDDIAILKATGFKKKDVHNIFIAEAMIIGVLGGILGLIVGYGIAYLINNIPFEQDFMPSLKTYPVTYNPVHYAIGISFALVTTYFAGFLPARKAAKLDPVEIIRGK